MIPDRGDELRDAGPSGYYQMANSVPHLLALPRIHWQRTRLSAIL